MKINEIKILKSNPEREKISAFINEVNECSDTYAVLIDRNHEYIITIVAVGTLAMEYTMRKVECTFTDYILTCRQ